MPVLRSPGPPGLPSGSSPGSPEILQTSLKSALHQDAVVDIDSLVDFIDECSWNCLRTPFFVGEGSRKKIEGLLALWAVFSGALGPAWRSRWKTSVS